MISGDYDLVVAIEMLHDVPDPVGILRTMRTPRAPGTVLVVDERTEETFTVPTNEMERFFYSFSTLHCLAVSMQNGGAGTGTVIRPDTMRHYATEAGFSTVETLDVEHPQFVLYRRMTPSPWVDELLAAAESQPVERSHCGGHRRQSDRHHRRHRPASVAPRRRRSPPGDEGGARGARVDRLEAAVVELQADGFEAVGVADRRGRSRCRSATSPTSRTTGSAGSTWHSSTPAAPSADRVVDPDLSVWHAAIDTNIVGLLHGLKAFLPRMLRDGAECSVSRRRRARGSTAPRTTPRLRGDEGRAAVDHGEPLRSGARPGPALARRCRRPATDADNLAGDDLSIWGSRRRACAQRGSRPRWSSRKSSHP